MITIKGELENGIVRPLEAVPDSVGRKVLITFLDDEDAEEKLLRKLSLQQPSAFLNQYLADDREDIYGEYLNQNNDNR